MPPIDQMSLSRRERQIMDILYEHGNCSAQQVLEHMADAPSYSSVRALIARLVDKELVTFRSEGNKHIYTPKVGGKKVQSSALQRLIKTFFRGSPGKAVSALLDMEGEKLSATEIETLERTISRIKKSKQED